MKETKELLVGLVVLGKTVADLAKDGVDIGDAVALAEKFSKDEVFKARVSEAVKGLDKIPDEFKDFDFKKGIELLGVMPELVSALGVLKV